MHRHHVIWLVLAFAACSGSGDGDGDVAPATEEQLREVCRAGCEFDVRCEGADPAGVETCTATCAADIPGLRGDIVPDFSECIERASCGDGGLSCFAAIEPLEVHRRWEDACVAKLDSCPDVDYETCEVDYIPDLNYNSFVVRLAPVHVEAMIECLNLPSCDERESCISEILSLIH